MVEVGTKTLKKIQAKSVLKKQNTIYLYSIKMSKKELKIDKVEVNQKELHASKQSIT